MRSAFSYIHKLIRMPDNSLFVVGEGYKRQASASGIALTALGAMAGSYGSAGVTKIVVTDLVIMQFNSQYKVTGPLPFMTRAIIRPKLRPR